MSDLTNNKVRSVAQLAKKDARSQTGLFLLEGVQGLKEVLAKPSLVVELYATEEAMDRHLDLFRDVAGAGIAVEVVSPVVMKKLCDTETPQGVLAVCQQVDVDAAARPPQQTEHDHVKQHNRKNADQAVARMLVEVNGLIKQRRQRVSDI